MHHLSNDPEVEVTPDRLTQFAGEHGGDIEFDNAANTAHWDHPNLPVRYFARMEPTSAERTEALLEEFGDLNVNVFTVARWATMHPSEPRGADYRPLEPIRVVRLVDVLALLAAREAKAVSA